MAATGMAAMAVQMGCLPTKSALSVPQRQVRCGVGAPTRAVAAITALHQLDPHPHQENIDSSADLSMSRHARSSSKKSANSNHGATQSPPRCDHSPHRCCFIATSTVSCLLHPVSEPRSEAPVLHKHSNSSTWCLQLSTKLFTARTTFKICYIYVNSRQITVELRPRTRAPVPWLWCGSPKRLLTCSYASCCLITNSLEQTKHW